MKQTNCVQDVLATHSVEAADKYSFNDYFGVVDAAMLGNIGLCEAMLQHEFGSKCQCGLGLGLWRIGVLS
jgi:hypothetical protein